jgi:hypothetical protein
MTAHSATRACLAALAAGASLTDALRIAASAAEGRFRRELEACSLKLSDPSFDRETITYLPFAPRIVGLLLSRAKPDSLAEVADLAGRALASRVDRGRLFQHPPLIALAALVVLAMGQVLDTYVAPIPPLGIIRSMIGAGQLVALAALVLAALAFVLGPERVKWARLVQELPALTPERILLWVAAGEVAGVAPDVVASALYRPIALGVSDRPRAVLHLLERGRLTVLAPLAGTAFPEESSGRTTLRIARLAAASGIGDQDRWRWLAYIAMGLVALGAYLVSAAVYSGISQLGTTL